MSDREQDEMADDVLIAKVMLRLDHLQEGLDEIKQDFRQFNNESPVLRIRQLESKYDYLSNKVEDKYEYLDNRWGRLVWFLALVFIALIGAYATALLTG